ncbi:MAG: hypothetical protein A2750_03440 [Candidatus Yanofskybacteria bacterium RIFCSPHIGHO2_01_FULL_45_42]|uniref:Uncharacterized protein n=3 Tax=Candidatus Yanofskyibacteriota TaxID=1752733 RepID=A0A1F8H449_9BACT|nr:MAG: hypothetical protein A2750_03440 [Candidatus Yanofskybacteria bacterium RIFCSPHIGHO2_01_FULL_45_42]OGN16124.1 MAG: hypothetical protein A3C81_00930 [Candidatus Yanofskybacteria bacterium RIFCSPHIGHO2_02_FULL_46_19]OGN26256.1 MAG: hypothetical protein A3B17_02730 [Candidatus Yanofskybacteria bacterium RIFCSPLOWO2_01_FULL_45_72]OGN31778.1 MAG: hypothetical protein A3J01_03245 [Candidatus Yanofskybacteria bacterium RIFCSPLOWO2_02_FULL_45_18]
MILVRRTVFATPKRPYEMYEYRITYEVYKDPTGATYIKRHPRSENIKVIRGVSYKEIEDWVERGIKPKTTATDND